jgi:cytochrome P450
MLQVDPPRSAPAHRAVTRFFAGQHLQDEIPRIEAIARRLASTFRCGPDADLARYCHQYVGEAATMSLGVPATDWDEIIYPLISTALAWRPDTAADEQIDAAWAAVYAYLAEVIECKRRRPDDSLLSRILQGFANDFTEDEAFHIAATLLSGWPTPEPVLTEIMTILVTRPDIVMECLARPELWATRLAELMQDRAHFALGNPRKTVIPARLPSGLELPADTLVMPSFTAGLRAPRNPGGQTWTLTYGTGPHRCPCIWWSTAMMQICVKAFFGEHPDAALAVSARSLPRLDALLPCPTQIPVARRRAARLAAGIKVRKASDMRLFDRSAGRLSTRTRLLLTADPGDALLDAARLYDPEVRRWHGRLVFRNGVLLFGPVAVTPKLEQQAALPAGMAVAYYTAAALQPHSQRRSDTAKQDDSDKLVRGLADRLGGTVQYAGPQPSLALLTSVYSEQGLAPDQVIEVLRPYGGNFRVEDETEGSYSLTGHGTYFYVAYWSPRLYRELNAPPAARAMRSRPLHHWDLNTGISPRHAARELVQKVGEATLALASRSGGIAVDMLGFPIRSPGDLALMTAAQA